MKLWLINMHMIYHHLLSNQPFLVHIFDQMFFIDTETPFYTCLAMGKYEDKLNYFCKTLDEDDADDDDDELFLWYG